MHYASALAARAVVRVKSCGAGLLACAVLLAAPPGPQMTADQKVLHALNRLTFGPRPGDAATVNEMSLEKWIEAQLHPNGIPENPVIDRKLVPLDTLRMSSAEMLRHYPPPQMVRAMANGRVPFPSDPAAQFIARKLAARFEDKNSGDKEPGERTATDETAQELLERIGSLPPAAQYNALDALPNYETQQLYAIAPDELRRRIQIVERPGQIINQDLTQARLYRAVYSNRQLEEVLTDFWYNHFNVYLDKGADRYLVTAYERDVIRPHVLGRFKDLLLATAESPAMLFYLDNWQSAGPDANPNRPRRRGLNENYGRELMELHTLGVDGGYTQHDVTEVARCFTGWTIRQPMQGGAFEYNDRLHDRGEKVVLGIRIPAGGGMSDGLKVIDILAHHPATAHFISKSLATRFVSDDPPEELVRNMAKTFTKTDGDLRDVMRTMIYSPEFWEPANFRSKVKSPLEFVASSIRAVNADVDYAFAVGGLMNQLGEPLYRKLEPTGYSNRSADWLNSASLLARMNFATTLAQGRFPGIKPGGDVDQPEAAAAGLKLASPEFQRR